MPHDPELGTSTHSVDTSGGLAGGGARSTRPRAEPNPTQNNALSQLLALLFSGEQFDPNQILQGLQQSPFEGGGAAQELQESTPIQPSINLVDVRTPGIKALEAGGLLQSLQTLLNPFGFSQQAQQQVGRGVPEALGGGAGAAGLASGAEGLLATLLGGGQPLPGGGGPVFQPNPQQPPPGGGGGPQLPPPPPPPPPPGTGAGGAGPPAVPPGSPGAPNDPSLPPPFGPGGAGGDPVFLPPPGGSGGAGGTGAGGAGGPTDPGPFNISQFLGQNISPNDLGSFSSAFQNFLTGQLGVPGATLPGGSGFGNFTPDERNLFTVSNPDPAQAETQLLDRINAILGGLGVQGLEHGGQIDPSQVTVVGEAGPEAILPGQDGSQQVVPITEQIMQMLLSGGATGMVDGGVLPPPHIPPPPDVARQNLLDFQRSGAPGGPVFGAGGGALPPPPTGFPGFMNPDGTAPSFGAGTFGGTLANTQQNSVLGDIAGGPNTQGPNPGLPQQGGQGAIQNMLGNNPEQQAFGQIQDILGGNPSGQAGQAFETGQGFIQNMLGQNPGQGVVDALQAPFERNLQFALGNLRNTAPSVFNSAQALQGTDLSRQALDDFNLLGAQALQQGVNQQVQGLGTLGQLGAGASQAGLGGLGALTQAAGQAGQNPFSRLLGAGQLGLQQAGLGEQSRQFNQQFDLAAQNQQFQQTVQPTLQLLLAAMGLAEPTALQTVVGSQQAG